MQFHENEISNVNFFSDLILSLKFMWSFEDNLIKLECMVLGV